MPWKSLYGEAEETISKQGRSFTRHSCRVRVRYRSFRAMGLYHQQDAYQTGWLRNQSKTGVMLETSHHISEGEKLELAFSSPDDKTTFRAEAVVCWMSRESRNLFHVGVKFEKLHES